MPPRKRAPRETIKVSVVCDVEVPRTQFKTFMESKGVETNGVNLDAWLGRYVRNMVHKKFEELGFPQQ